MSPIQTLKKCAANTADVDNELATRLFEIACEIESRYIRKPTDRNGVEINVGDVVHVGGRYENVSSITFGANGPRIIAETGRILVVETVEVVPPDSLHRLFEDMERALKFGHDKESAKTLARGWIERAEELLK